MTPNQISYSKVANLASFTFKLFFPQRLYDFCFEFTSRLFGMIGLFDVLLKINYNRITIRTHEKNNSNTCMLCYVPFGK